ncbi:hypothetical protein JD844_021444 [Phrynosoma platyrhinos]|uniref:Uncharacterized protein n=1 Tax=Phrynosoma platyrhinos TaxID=52577 RepID=A0ABQ7STS9_PHRPL|nr:hypothetical protein JD844_021444 [Phrynosoma platyrhinos]
MSSPNGSPSPQPPLLSLRRCREAASELAVMLRAALGPGAARLFYYPTLLYTLVRERLPGSQRPWFSRIDQAVLLGALPLRGRCRQLIDEENVRGVLTMNEEYETRFLCCSPQEWEAMGVEQLRLSTVDLTGVPSLENLHKGVEFVLKHRERGNCVYVHQWTPQEAIEAIAKIRPHIIVRSKQVQLLEDFHKCVTVGTKPSQEKLDGEHEPAEQIQNNRLKTPGS